MTVSACVLTYFTYLLTYLLTYNYLGDASPVGSASPAAPGLPREPRGLDSRVPECSDCEYSDNVIVFTSAGNAVDTLERRMHAIAAYVHEFLRRSREVQRTLRVAGPEVPRRMGGAAVKGRGGAQHGSGKVGRGKGTGGKKGPSGALGGLLESFSDSEAGD